MTDVERKPKGKKKNLNIEPINEEDQERGFKILFDIISPPKIDVKIPFPETEINEKKKEVLIDAEESNNPWIRPYMSSDKKITEIEEKKINESDLTEENILEKLEENKEIILDIVDANLNNIPIEKIREELGVFELSEDLSKTIYSSWNRDTYSWLPLILFDEVLSNKISTTVTLPELRRIMIEYDKYIEFNQFKIRVTETVVREISKIHESSFKSDEKIKNMSYFEFLNKIRSKDVTLMIGEQEISLDMLKTIYFSNGINRVALIAGLPEINYLSTASIIYLVSYYYLINGTIPKELYNNCVEMIYFDINTNEHISNINEKYNNLSKIDRNKIIDILLSEENKIKNIGVNIGSMLTKLSVVKYPHIFNRRFIKIENEIAYIFDSQSRRFWGRYFGSGVGNSIFFYFNNGGENSKVNN